MSLELTVPNLGESISEAVVGKWHKQVGEAVQPDEPVVVLETDKVTVDVPAPGAGSLATINRKEGDKVKVGEVLGTIAPGSGAAASAPAPAKQAETPQSTPRAAVESAPPAPAKQAQTPQSSPRVAVESAPIAPLAENGRLTALTPVAKRVVQDRGIDPATIRGSGPRGKILKDDVLGQLERPPAPRQLRSEPRPLGEREERVKMTPLRRRVAERLLSAQWNAAILTTFNEIDMSAVIALRKGYQEKFANKHGVKLGFMSFFVRAAIEALKAFPEVNAEIDGDDVIFKHYYDIGVAVSGSRGLVVPVIRDADRLSLAELERAIAEFAEKARTDKLTLGDLQGGTFTISNGGIFGSMLSTPILNPPQTGILGMHNIQDRPVVRDGQIAIRPIMYVALSYDHRLIDGREAVQFLVRIKECIEDPQRVLLDV